MRKPPGYWQNIENVVCEAKQLMATLKLDYLPTSSTIEKLGYHALSSAISEYHGGIKRFREVLGFTSTAKPQGYWKNIENVISEAKKCMGDANLEQLPGKSYLKKQGYSSLLSAIYKYHGSMHKFRKILGQEQLRVEHGKWSDLHYTIEEMQKLLENNDLTSIPSQEQIFQLGGSPLLNAIDRYHGGLNEFRKILKQENLQREKGTWKSLEFCLNYAKQVMIELGYKTLPRAKLIQTSGHSVLAYAITKYHGGYHNFRRMLHENSKRHKKGSLLSEDYVKKAVLEIMESNNFGVLPTPNVFRSLGQANLVNAIYKYHGGFRRFRALLRREMPSEKEKMEYILKKYVE